MTNAFIRDFDALAHASFAALGMADVALYTPADRDRATVQCRVFVDRSAQASGFLSQAESASVTVRVLLADIGGVPRSGAVFDVGEIAGRYVVDRVLDEDESTATCLVSREIPR